MLRYGSRSNHLKKTNFKFKSIGDKFKTAAYLFFNIFVQNAKKKISFLYTAFLAIFQRHRNLDKIKRFTLTERGPANTDLKKVTMSTFLCRYWITWFLSVWILCRNFVQVLVPLKDRKKRCIPRIIKKPKIINNRFEIKLCLEKMF
jgi:hypothetical protein